jgi:phospholipase C
MPEFTRRRFLGTAAAGGTAATLLPASVQKALATPPNRPGRLSDIKHVVPSVLQFLEKVTGVMEPNITAWRRRSFGDLTRTLRLSRHTPAPVIPDPDANLNLATYEVARLPAPAFPGATQNVPHQERGSHPRII